MVEKRYALTVSYTELAMITQALKGWQAKTSGEHGRRANALWSRVYEKLSCIRDKLEAI